MKDGEKKTKSVSGRVSFTAPPEREFLNDREWYRARFKGIEEGQGQYGPYWRFTFEILDGEKENGEDATGTLVSATRSYQPYPGSKFATFVEKMLGKKIGEDEELDLDAYKGKTFKVLIADTEKDDKRYQNVEMAKPIDKKKTATPPSKPVKKPIAKKPITKKPVRK